jgi:hypothetical protein
MTDPAAAVRDPANTQPPLQHPSGCASDFLEDIPLAELFAPRSGTVRLPEEQARSVRANYAATLEEDYGDFRNQAKEGETLDELSRQFERYRQGYRRHCLHYLESLAPPEAFTSPTRRRVRTAENRRQRMVAFRLRARAAITRILRPDLAPISSDRPAEGLVRLAAKLKVLKARLARMEHVNVAHTKFVRSPASLDALGLTPEDRILVREYRPKDAWSPHPFAPYQLQNHRASIRRVRGQIEEFKVKVQTAAKTNIDTACTGYLVRQNFALNRIQLLFPAIPPEPARDYLHSRGFRWAPSRGAWQRHLNPSIVHEMTAGRYRAELEKLLPGTSQQAPEAVN